MNYFKNLKRSHLVVLVSLATFVSFSTLILSGSVLIKKILYRQSVVTSIQKAHKLSLFNDGLNFERSLKSFEELSIIGLYSLGCDPVYVTDITLNAEKCSLREGAQWIELNLSGKRYLLGMRYSPDTSGIAQSSTISGYLIAFSLFFAIILSVLSFVFFILIPSQLITREIEQFVLSKAAPKPFPEDSKFVFSYIFKSLNKLVSKIVEDRDAVARSEVSRQVAHDLRSPIAVLFNSLEPTHPKYDLLHGAASRIDQISNSLFASSNSFCSVNLKSLAKEFEGVCKTYGLKLSFDSNVSRFSSHIFDVDLYRFVTNLLKNAAEAGCTLVNVSFLAGLDYLTVSVVDDGPGMPEDLVHLMNQKIFSTKSTGNGLGLTFIKNKMASVGGSFKISNAESGLKVEFQFPIFFSDLSITKMVLVDDDKYVGLSWRQNAEKDAIPFAFHRTRESLLASLENIHQDTHFFIDRHIGDDCGLDLLQFLFDQGFRRLYLATGDTDSSAACPSFVLTNVGKRYPV